MQRLQGIKLLIVTLYKDRTTLWVDETESKKFKLGCVKI